MITIMTVKGSMPGSGQVQSKKRRTGGTWHRHLSSKATKISQETLSSTEKILKKY